MAKEISKQALSSVFEQIKQTDESGNEFWAARQLSKVLEYADFRNFTTVINKAKEACKNSRQNPLEHFVEFNEVLAAGQGAKHTYDSYKLSRLPENLPVADSIKTVQKKLDNKPIKKIVPPKK